tara:strand:- start:277 stop:1191 length:915 start_codon:yes stop_codon:yes gene_type:complete
MDAKEAMTSYCRAQAEINKVARESDESRKLLSERIKTYRSLLQDELVTRKLSCIEVTPTGETDPIYFRIKEGNVTSPIEINMVMTILKGVDGERLLSFAEKSGHDLPKMFAAMLNFEIKERYTKKSGNMQLSISNAKERGYVRQHTTPNEVVQLAHDLYSARSELAKLRDTSNKRKQSHVEEQKIVEETVKTSLKEKDPVNKMTRVHMMQDGDEWVYYLRCKEKIKKPTLGVRKIVPMVEDALVKTLQSQGFGREFTNTFKPSPYFWDEVTKHLSSSINETLSGTQLVDSLTLDRGAPRKPKKT